VQLPGADAEVAFLPDEGQIRLTRGGEVLLRLPLAGLQVGSVPALQESVNYDPYWLEYGEDLLPRAELEDLRWHRASDAEVVSSGAGAGAGARDQSLALRLHLTEGLAAELRLRADGPGRFSAQLVPDVEAAARAGRAVAFIRLSPRATGEEGFYGLGEWPDEVNHRGKVRPMQMEFDNTESANNENHVPVPLLIGTRGWGLFVESRHVGVFAVANKEPDLIEVTYGTAFQSAAGLRFHLLSAGHPLDILRRYFEITGFPLLPAEWGLGPWIWRNENRDQAQVEDDIRKIRGLDLATSAIWIDRPYASGVNSFDFKPSQFPNPKEMIRQAHAAGLRMALWSTPYLEDAAATRPLRQEAIEKGYYPKRSGLPFNSWFEKPIDFTNPQAYAFWQGLIRRYTDLGIEGFKLDYAEDVVPGLGTARNAWLFADGSEERTMHHDYTLLYHRVYAETLPRSGGYLLCRAGRWGDQRNVSVIWPGDMDATFTRHKERFVPRPEKGDKKEVIGVGGLPATVAQGLGLSASGFPFFGADTGGYIHGPPSRELFIRWFQQTALSTVMNVGDSTSQTPWETTPENMRDQTALDRYREYARLHLRLFPYEWTYAQRMKEDGRPITRPLGLAHPELGAHPPDEYLFGDDLLVAPVVAAGQMSRQVVLPAGQWLRYWDGAVYDGGAGGVTVTVPAPLNDPDGLPLLVRAGAIVPLLRPEIDTLSPATLPGVESFANDPGVLWVRVFSGPASRFTVYDGAQISQEPGAPSMIEVKGGSVFGKGFMIERVRTGRPAGVSRGGQAMPERATLQVLTTAEEGWFWEAAAGGTLWIKVGPGAHRVEIR
jgi:alpha-D-xyloside xylohydrolase